MNCSPMTTPKYCYRHSPKLINARSQDTLNSIQLQKELNALSIPHQVQISQVWDIFQQSSKLQRHLILKGILSSACTSQLSFISSTIKPLLSNDFTVVFPPEITKQVFSLLDASSLCAAAQVSHHWKQLADDDTLWHRMCEQHINKKCTKCGWGLPLLRKRKVVRIDTSSKRIRSETEPTIEKVPELINKCDQTTSPAPLLALPAPTRGDRRPWKDVYSERLVVERNWRRNKSTTRVFKSHHTSSISSLQFCEAQNVLITGSLDKTAIVWNLETGQFLRQLKGHARCIRTLQFDETKLVTGSMDNTLRIWNYHTGQCIRTLEGHTDGVVHLDFNCRLLASGSADSTIKIWNFQTGECFTLTGHGKSVNHVSLQKGDGGKTLVSSSDDVSIRVWDLEKRTCVRVLSGHLAAVQTAVPSMPGFAHAFFNGKQKSPIVFKSKARAISPASSISSSDEEDIVNTTVSSTVTVGNSKDCDRSSEPIIISGSLDNTLKVWSLETGECLQTLFGHVQGINTLAYDKLRLVSGSEDGSLKLWDIENGLPMHCLEGHTSAITSVMLSDTKVVSADRQGEVRIWDFGVQ